MDDPLTINDNSWLRYIRMKLMQSIYSHEEISTLVVVNNRYIESETLGREKQGDKPVPRKVGETTREQTAAVCTYIDDNSWRDKSGPHSF